MDRDEASTGRLRCLAPELWAIEQRKMERGVHLRIRMTVVRLSNGGLWLHSPVRFDADLVDALAGLGPVEHIVAPNRFHHLHVLAAKQRYPTATLWAAPGLPQKRRDIGFDAVLDARALPWDGVLESEFISGFPAMNEVVFFHSSSRTLICADFLFNVREESHWFTRLLWRSFGVWKSVAQNRAWRFMLKDRRAAAEAVDRVLAWDFDRVIMAHGDVIDENGHELVVRATRWLLRD